MEVDRLGQQWLATGALAEDEAHAFQAAVEKLAAMYRTHIEFEDSVLFPLAVRTLSRSQSAEIAGEMAKRRNVRGTLAQERQLP